jgi:hypothetical protein
MKNSNKYKNLVQVFSRNAYCLVTDKRIWKTPAGLKKWIEK